MLALGPSGEAVVTSNAVHFLWRIEPQTLAVSVHELSFDSDTDREVGFVAIAYSADGKYFATGPPTRTTVAPLPPVERKRSASGHAPMVEQVSIIAVK